MAGFDAKVQSRADAAASGGDRVLRAARHLRFDFGAGQGLFAACGEIFELNAVKPLGGCDSARRRSGTNLSRKGANLLECAKGSARQPGPAIRTYYLGW